jgi:hypothetical protein
VRTGESRYAGFVICCGWIIQFLLTIEPQPV